MKIFDIPLVVLLSSTIYLCFVYLGLGWLKRLSASSPPKENPLEPTETVRTS